MRVFVSHASRDDAQVTALATAPLAARHREAALASMFKKHQNTSNH